MVQEPGGPNVLTASSGQQNEPNNVAGPSSYPTGGFSIRTNLGRVDQAIIQGDNSARSYKVQSTPTNHIVATAHSAGSSGTELASGTDLSSDNIVYDAYRL